MQRTLQESQRRVNSRRQSWPPSTKLQPRSNRLEQSVHKSFTLCSTPASPATCSDVLVLWNRTTEPRRDQQLFGNHLEPMSWLIQRLFDGSPHDVTVEPAGSLATSCKEPSELRRQWSSCGLDVGSLLPRRPFRSTPLFTTRRSAADP
jgi:hypothetical protein